MDTELERTRMLHAEIEQLKAAMVRDLTSPAKGYTKELQQEKRTKGRILKLIENAKKLEELYKDTNSRRANELQSISGRGSFNLFKDKVREMRTYHKANPTIGEAAVEEHMPGVGFDVEFTGEEMSGRFFDLHHFHKEYLNLKIFNNPKSPDEKIDYQNFLERIFSFHYVKQQLKGPQYKKFYEELLQYLKDFWGRTRMMFPPEKVVSRCKEEFDATWASKEVEGWQKPWTKEAKRRFKREQEDGEDEKDEEEEGGEEYEGPLYCSVLLKTFQDYTYFQNRTKGKKFKKYTNRLNCEDPICRDIAWLEAQVLIFVQLMEDNYLNTLEYIEKKQTRTYREIKAALEEAEKSSSEEEFEDDDDDDEQIYNPLRIPLDFDGKPIPYWLYKLRGLNRYFKCEICGGHPYRGPQAFHRHFREWRHAHGMRTLGIPNTKDFHLITEIDDAIALYERIKRLRTQKTSTSSPRSTTRSLFTSGLSD